MTTFGILTPFYFLRAGTQVHLPALAAMSAVILASARLGAAWAQEPQRIRVTVERQDSAGWIAVNAAHVFEPNDRLRFLVSVSLGGYLYVMDQGTSGDYALLFPRSASDGLDISADRPYG